MPLFGISTITLLFNGLNTSPVSVANTLKTVFSPTTNGENSINNSKCFE